MFSLVKSQNAKCTFYFIWMIYNMSRIVATHNILKNNLNNISKIFSGEKQLNFFI